MDKDEQPDDDVKANLRHVQDEAINFLREHLLSDNAGSSLFSKKRIDLALQLLQLPCPPG